MVREALHAFHASDGKSAHFFGRESRDTGDAGGIIGENTLFSAIMAKAA
jgi:hypothetical protein